MYINYSADELWKLIFISLHILCSTIKDDNLALQNLY